ncbi:MAG: hypothetical protein K8I00_02555 [Candidatus Omnitrophica bacterium]|nr:hypothetical protein [Candidatus Omnitrophota bacterium]
MRGLFLSWILVGIFLWGLPTGFAVSLFLASVSFQGGAHVTGLQGDHLAASCLWILPLFMGLGVVVGIIMGRLSEQARTR